MPFTPSFEKIYARDKKVTFTESVAVSTKTDILTEDIKRILNISAFSVVVSSVQEASKIGANGKVVFFVCYENEEGVIKKCEISTDFSGNIGTGELEKCKVSVHSYVEKTEANASNIKLELSAVIILKATVSLCNERQVLSGGENLVCDMREYSIKKGLGLKKIVYPIDEEFELPYAIKEVMFHNATPVVTAVQCGVGSIIIDGEVRLCAILLQNDEKNIIIRENKNIPFRVEMEYDEGMPALSANARVELKTFKTDITVDDESGKSLVNASVTLNFEGEVFAVDTVSLAVDAFSTTDKTALETAELTNYESCDMRYAQEEINLGVDLTDEEQGKTLKTVSGERVEILSSEVKDDKLWLTGSVSFVGYFLGEEQKITTRRLETPFDVSVDVALPCGAINEVLASIECGAIKVTQTGAEIQANLSLMVFPECCSKIKYVKEIVSTGEKELEKSAISIYIPAPNEQLWSLCKKLNQTPEQLISANHELQFPLVGNERIVVYRQK